MDVQEKVLENRLRRTLARRGYVLHKSRRRDPLSYDFGGYIIVDASTNGVVCGGSPLVFSMSLADVDQWVSEMGGKTDGE